MKKKDGEAVRPAQQQAVCRYLGVSENRGP